MRIRPAIQPVLAFLALMAGIGMLLTACAWSVPADPGVNAAVRGAQGPGPARGSAASGSARVDDARARALYLDHCTRCHEPVPPASIAAADWPRYVRRYGPQAGLFGADRARVLRWLQAHTR